MCSIVELVLKVAKKGCSIAELLVQDGLVKVFHSSDSGVRWLSRTVGVFHSRVIVQGG